jgi:hypothetical protein|tara:strand:+ start:1604 stop:1879 length:276 start_codon:yes stop_codon:yes gene_type:complete
MIDRIKVEGAIFTNSYKKQPKHPDWTGTIELSKSILKELVERAKANQDISIRVAMWDRESKEGKTYKYVSVELPQLKEEQADDGFDDEIPF